MKTLSSMYAAPNVGWWLLSEHDKASPKHSHILSFHSKTLQNSNKLGYIGIKLEQAVSKATWLTTVQITSEGREQSNLTYNLQTNYGLTVVGREHNDLTYNSTN